MRFFRNGDKYYGGFEFPIAFVRYKQFGTLLKSLSNSVFCDQKRLPLGVRCIFDLDGTRIRSITDFKDGCGYVCSSNAHFIAMDYLGETKNPIWKTSSQNANSTVPVKPLVLKDKHFTRSLSVYASNSLRSLNNYSKSNTQRTIVVVKNGPNRPRKMFRWTFSLQPLPQFSALMAELCRLLDIKSISHLCTVENSEIHSLSDILKVDTVFFAFSESTINENDFLLSNQELTLINFMKEAKLKGSDSKLTKKFCESRFKNSFQIPNKMYDVGAKIGSGTFSSVRECLNKKTNELVALKRVDLSRCRDNMPKLKKEVDLIKQLSHPNIVKLIDSFETQESFYMVLEYIPNSDLINTILESKYYSEQDIGGVIHNLVSALQYLHSLDIVHRDVKVENVLVQKSKTGMKKLKLCDFGLATKMKDKKSMLKTVCGTPIYMAPEVILQQGYDHKVDLWAVGVVLYLLTLGTPPFSSPSKDFNIIFDVIVEGNFKREGPAWNILSNEAQNLIQLLLEQEPSKRLSAEEVLNYPWVSSDKVASKFNLRATVGPKLHQYFGNNSYYKQEGNNAMAKTVFDKDSNYFEMADNEEEEEEEKADSSKVLQGDH